MSTIYALILVTCVNDAACRERRSADWVYASALSCAVDAQREFSLMLADDPRLTLKSFRCEPAGGQRT